MRPRVKIANRNPWYDKMNFRGVGWYFSLHNFNRTFCKQTVKILIRHPIMNCLPLSHKKDSMLIWVLTKQDKNIDISSTVSIDSLTESLRKISAFDHKNKSFCNK